MTSPWIPRILLVEGSDAYRTKLVEMFSRHGCKVTAVSCAERAMQHLESLNSRDLPHLIVTNIKIPGVTGQQLVERLCEFPVYRQLAIIAYSQDPLDLNLRFTRRQKLHVVPLHKVEEAVETRVASLRSFYTMGAR